MSPDGGLAEAINVHIDENEQAPTLPPEDITETYFRTSTRGPAIFIHKGYKGQRYDNLIFLDEATGRVKATPKNSGPVMGLFKLNNSEEISSVKSVGNTLVFCTNQRMMYVLYREGEYKELGDQIPIPAMEFRTHQEPVSVIGDRELKKELISSFNPITGSGDYDRIKGWDTIAWRKVLANSVDAEDYIASYNEIVQDVWNMIKAQMKRAKRLGYFCTPVFVRYALRLYDGSYIYQSVPILLGAGENDFIKAYGLRDYPELTANCNSYICVELTNLYQTTAHLSHYNYDGWEDIVKTIEIFLSTDIHTPLLNSDITDIDDVETAYIDNKIREQVYVLSFNDDDNLESGKRRDEILSKANFYRIATFPVDNTSALEEENGYNLMSKKKLLSENDETTSQDILVEQPELPDDYMSFHKKRADDLFQYNNKVILTGVSQQLTSGYPFLNGTVLHLYDKKEEDDEYRWFFKIAFYLRDASNKTLVVFWSDMVGNQGIQIDESYRKGPIEIHGVVQKWYARPFAWLAYPDPRCYQVDVACSKNGYEWDYTRYKMEAHPNLQCSFVYLGLDKPLGFTPGEELPDGYVFPTEENRILREDNIIWASEMDNPFVFPVTGRLSFNSEIISIANATKALSEGQFGQFPLYVFTKDGIWSVPISSTGGFTASLPMSRDVALSKNSVQALEQSIAFVTSQGVMLLQGSNIENISPYMNGRHYALEDDVKLLLRRSEWGDISPICEDDTTFMGFVTGSKIAYDYNGRRIIFFRDGYYYQYEYYITSGTWHKITGDMLQYTVLNSYPECYIGATFAREGVAENIILNYSTVLDDAGKLSDTVEPVKGIIITRPFNLGEPDIRKTIKQVRIRGKFNRNDVKYILLGSFDDIHWQRLHSLRGGSYKSFRMIIVFNLSPTERISWVDIDYESRFTNKLR